MYYAHISYHNLGGKPRPARWTYQINYLSDDQNIRGDNDLVVERESDRQKVFKSLYLPT